MEPTWDEIEEPKPFRTPAWARVIRRCGNILAVVGSIVSMAIMLGMVADVISRSASLGSIPGMIEIIQTFLVVVVFLGLAQAEATGAHVRMNLVTRALPFNVRRVVKAIGMAICAVVSAWMAWASTSRAIHSTISDEVEQGLLSFPVWPARIVMAAGFILLVFEYMVRVREEWLGHTQEVTSTDESDASIADED